MCASELVTQACFIALTANAQNKMYTKPQNEHVRVFVLVCLLAAYCNRLVRAWRDAHVGSISHARAVVGRYALQT